MGLELAVLVTQIVSTLVLAATLVVVIIYTKKTSEMSSATAAMAEQSQAQRYDQMRPLLVPSGAPNVQQGHPTWLDWNSPQHEFWLRNVGNGVALNVCSVLYGCESYALDELGHVTRLDGSQDNHWTCWLAQPITPNENPSAVYFPGSSVFYCEQKHIGVYSFNAPAEPNPGVIAYEKVSYVIARLVTTYEDVFGRKHASIFDYVQHLDGWKAIAFLTDISASLQDLDGR